MRRSDGRPLVELAVVVAGVVVMAIGLFFLLAQFVPDAGRWIVLIIGLIFLAAFLVMVPLGISLWLSALAIRYRDVKFAMPFVIRMLIYSAPIVYTASAIPEKWRLVYSLNPIVGVIEGYRAALLGTEVPWMFIVPGIVTCVILVIGGLLYFHRMEKVFVDVI